MIDPRDALTDHPHAKRIRAKVFKDGRLHLILCVAGRLRLRKHRAARCERPRAS